MAYDLNDWKMILAPCALTIFMLWDIALDIAKDHMKVFSWMPSNLFVLSSLTIQILSYVDVQKVNVFHPCNQNYLEVLVDSQLEMDAARLTMCVFVGCLLPGMAMAGTIGSWSNVAALFVSLSFHIAIEIYTLQNVNNSRVEREAGPWFVSSGVVLLVGASSLVLLLGAVILSGVLTREGFRSTISEIHSKDVENEGDRCKRLRSEVMKSWVAARAWKISFFGCSSVFSPGAGMIVTICVAVMAAKLACRSSLLHHDNGEGNLTFYLQCIFILVGWILMLCRWFKAVLYCAISVTEASFFIIIVYFFAPAILVYPWLPEILLHPECFSNPKIVLKNILIFFFCLVSLLPLCILILPISLLLLFCFICWHFSALVFGSQFIQHLCKLDKKAVSENDEFSKYRSMLYKMRGFEKDHRTFSLLNKKSFDRIKGRMDEGNKIGQSCTGLLSIMGNARLAENQRLQRSGRNGNDWMGAISRIFSFMADIDIGVVTEDSLTAFWETWDVLMFVDCPDNIVVDPFNIFGTLNLAGFIARIWCEKEMRSVERKLKQDLVTSVEEKRKRLERKLTRGEQVRVEILLKDFNETTSNSVFTRLKECRYNNVEELGEMLRTLVGHVIFSSLLDASDVLVKYTKQWAESLEEGKIEKGVEVAGKVSALLEKVVEDGGIHPEETGQVPSQSGAKASEGDDIEAAA